MKLEFWGVTFLLFALIFMVVGVWGVVIAPSSGIAIVIGGLFLLMTGVSGALCYDAYKHKL